MLNKSHRSVVSTCVMIIMPYFKKNKKINSLKKKKKSFLQKKKHNLKKTVLFPHH